MKAIVTYLILTLLVCRGNTQTSSPDSVCLPIRDAQKVLKAAKDSKIFKAERDTARKLIVLMDQRIRSKDSTINNLSSSLTQHGKLIDSYKREVDNLEDQRDKQKLDTQYYENLYNKEKKKAGGWKAGTGAAVLLLLAKLFFK